MSLEAIAGFTGAYAKLIDIEAGNIAAAGDPGRSTVMAGLTTVSPMGELTALKVTVPRIYQNHELAGEIRTEFTNVGYNTTLGEMLAQIDRLLGQPGAATSITSQIGHLQNAFARFAARPENTLPAVRTEVVNAAQNLAKTFRDIEDKIQKMLVTCDTQLDAAVTELKSHLKNVAEANQKISAAIVANRGTGLHEDKRRAALNEVSTMLDIHVEMNVDGAALVTSHNRDLLKSSSAGISFAQVGGTGPKKLVIDTVDVTTQLESGKIKALFELRDTILPSLSEKFSQMADALKNEVNSVHNKASSYPGLLQMVGSKQVAGADGILAQGSFRLATTNNQGVIQAVQDISLAGVTTVTGVVNAINTAMGANATASIDANGHVKIVPAGGNNIVLNENTSKVLPKNIKVELFTSAGVSIRSDTYDAVALGSMAAVVAAMNTNFGANASAVLDGNKIIITAMGTNQLSMDNFPKVSGVTVRERGISDYFGLNDFFHADVSPLSPHASSSLAVNPEIVKKPSLIGHNALSMTAVAGGMGVTNEGLPDASGQHLAHLFPNAFNQRVQFYSTLKFDAKKVSFREFSAAVMGFVGSEMDNAANNKEMAEIQREHFTNIYDSSSKQSMRDSYIKFTELVTAMNTLYSVMGQMQKMHSNLTSIA